MGHFGPISTFEVFSGSVHKVFLKLQLTKFIKNCQKWLLGYLRNWTFFGLKNVKTQTFQKICSWDFSEILCDDRHWKGSESYWFFIFQYSFDFSPRTPLNIFEYKIDLFHISYFFAFFPDSFDVRTRGPLLFVT